MPLPYRQVLERYDRARAFGETKSLADYAKHLNEIYQTEDFSEGLRDGPWTRASTRADQYLGDTLGQVTGPLGEAFGGLFGHPEAGKQVGLGLPRALIQTAPLYLAGPEAGLPATAAALAGTGALFGAQTYADTGSAKSAAISGGTAMALPVLGKFAGSLGARAFGGAKVAGEIGGKPFNEILPKTAEDVFKVQAGRFLGSQTAQAVAQAGSTVAQNRVEGGDMTFGEAFTSPEFLLGQIPFTVYDAVHMARSGSPTRESVLPKLDLTEKAKPKVYTPPPPSQEHQAQLETLVNGFDQLHSDPNATPEQRSEALRNLVNGVNEPAKVVTREEIAKPTVEAPVKLVGRVDKVGDSYRVLVDTIDTPFQTSVTPGSTVWVNGAEPTFNAETGRMEFDTKIRNLKPALHPLGEGDFGVPQVRVDPNQPDLSVQPPPVSISEKSINAIANALQNRVQEARIRLTTPDKQTLQVMGVPADQVNKLPESASFERLEDSDEIKHPASLAPNGDIFVGGIHAMADDNAVAAGHSYKDLKRGWVTYNGKFLTDEQVTKKYGTSESADIGNVDEELPEDVSKPYIKGGVEPKQLAKLTETSWMDDALAERRAKGWDDKWPFVPADLQNKAFVEAIITDPGIAPEERAKILAFVPAQFRSIATELSQHPEQLQGQDHIVSTAMRDKTNPENMVVGPEWNTPHATLTKPALAKGIDDTNLEYGFVVQRADGTREFVPRSEEVTAIAEKAGQAKDVTGELHSQLLTKVKSSVAKFEQAKVEEGRAREKVAAQPTKPEEFTELVDVNTAKPRIDAAITKGATPTQAVEAARLQDQTPVVDESLTEQNVQKDTVHHVVNEGLYGEQAKYGEALKGEDGKRLTFPSRSAAMQYLDEYVRDNEGGPTYTIRDNGRGGYYLAPKENVKVQFDAGDEGGMEGVLSEGQPLLGEDRLQEEATNLGREEAGFEVADTPVEDRPDVSRQAVLTSLEVAGRNPEVFGELIDPDIVEGDPVQLAQKAKIGLLLGDQGLDKVNAELRSRGIEPFKNLREMTTQMSEIMKAARIFERKFRNLTLDSVVPGDAELGRAMGMFGTLQDLAKYIGQQKEVLGPVADLVEATVNSGVLPKDTVMQIPGMPGHEPGEGFWMSDEVAGVLPSKLNIPHFPEGPGDVRYHMNLAHEIIHLAEVGLSERTDPASVEYRGQRDKVLDALRKSKAVPQKVRATVDKMVAMNAYEKLLANKLNPDEFRALIVKGVGKENMDYFSYVYAMQHPKEMVATMFTDPRVIAIAEATPMGKTGIVESALNFISKAFNKLVGGSVKTETALSTMLKSYDNYLTGGIMKKVYNGAKFVRDSLVAEGVRPDALASRMQTIDRTFVRGTLDASITGFQREMDAGLLPVTAMGAENRTRLANYLNDPTFRGASFLNAENERVPLTDVVSDLQWLNRADESASKKRFEYINDLRSLDQNQVINQVNGENVVLGDFVRDLDWVTKIEGGGLNPDLITSLRAPTPDVAYDSTMNLLAHELPQHQELLWRMQQDIKLTEDLVRQVKEGKVLGSLPANIESNLALSKAKLNSMRKALKKQGLALERWNNLDQFDPQGWERSVAEGLTGRTRNVEPPDEVPDATEVRKLVGLEKLQGGGLSWLAKTFMLTQHLKGIIPETKPIIGGVNDEMGRAHERATLLNGAYIYNPETRDLDINIKKSNDRVATSQPLSEAASDLFRWQNKEGASKTLNLRDPAVVKVLSRFNDGDRKAILQLLTSQWQRHHVWADQVLPPALGTINRDNTALLIAARETGMLPEQSRELSTKLYEGLRLLVDPAQSPVGAEMLRQLAPKMQPDTYMAVLKHAQTLSESTANWIKRIRDNPGYTTEQRYGTDKLVMLSPKGDKFFTSGSKEQLQKIQSAKAAEGYTFMDYIRAEDVAKPNFGMREDTLNALDQLDAQNEQIVAELLKDQPEVAARILPRIQRAGDVRAAIAAGSPLPVVKRKFAEGREHINMVDNANQFYVRMNNWIRNKATRARTNLDMMHPQIEGNAEVAKLMQQHVQNFLTPDNPLARKIVETTYFYKLAFDVGNALLEGTQNLTTGMSALIAETGSVSDAFGLWGGAIKELTQRFTTKKWSDPEIERLMDRAKTQGHQGLASWSDIVDPDTNTVLDATPGVASTPIGIVKNGAKRFTTLFTRFNDLISLVSAFKLGREKGMNFDEAYNFAVDVKQRGLFTGGKAQRPIGMWSIKTKPVPQLMSALQTYSLGWFSQMAENYTKGFGKAPAGLTETQRLGAKKAFIYSIMAQGALAGALGLPGVGQGLALLGQATDTDPKGWLRQNLAKLFEEDQQAGGVLTSLALRGIGNAGLPFDPSSRASVSVPFLGIDAYKGFDVANLGGAATSTVADFATGLLGLMHGDTTAASKMMPNVAKRPFQLWQGDGDVRDRRGALQVSLSPAERFAMAVGITPTRVQTQRDTSDALNKANRAAIRQKEGFVDELAVLVRKGNTAEVQQKLIQYTKEHPGESVKELVRAVAGRVETQTVPYDWRRDVNPGVELAGLTNATPSTELARRKLREGVMSSLGVFPEVNGKEDYRAALVDDLLNSNPLLTRSQARRDVSRKTQVQSPYTWLQN